ncbi:hypothetical protein [Amycolatopsis sp. NPDC004169]|uniref:hypothetical protein n=1 Tax=Amycolatopsis sp. NPDC004169 TaxID=3154453 RepID=UPI0033BB7EE7
MSSLPGIRMFVFGLVVSAALAAVSVAGDPVSAAGPAGDTPVAAGTVTARPPALDPAAIPRRPGETVARIRATTGGWDVLLSNRDGTGALVGLDRSRRPVGRHELGHVLVPASAEETAEATAMLLSDPATASYLRTQLSALGLPAELTGLTVIATAFTPGNAPAARNRGDLARCRLARCLRLSARTAAGVWLNARMIVADLTEHTMFKVVM